MRLRCSPSRTLHLKPSARARRYIQLLLSILERPRTSYETVEPAWAACLRPTWPPEGARPEGVRGCSAGGSSGLPRGGDHGESRAHTGGGARSGETPPHPRSSRPPVTRFSPPPVSLSCCARFCLLASLVSFAQRRPARSGLSFSSPPALTFSSSSNGVNGQCTDGEVIHYKLHL